VGSQGQILKGNEAKVGMEERPGLTIPMEYNLVCVSLVRTDFTDKFHSS